MSGRILCAVDIAEVEHSKVLLRRSRLLAELDQAGLDVVTVIPGFRMSVLGSYFPEGSEEKIEAGATVELRNLVADSLGADHATDTRTIVATGSIYEGIVKTAKDVGSTLIVMGAHRPDLEDYLLGPNSSRVARHAHCSVYILRG